MNLGVSTPKHRYVALDSLRGVAACMVVLYHFFDDSTAVSLNIIQNAWLFVDFFFVLSGFVIAASYEKRLSEGYPVDRFMIQRLFRVYPLHVFLIIIYLCFEIAFAIFAPEAASRQPFDGTYSLQSLVSSLLLVQIFVGPDSLFWNGPSWSIAAEFWTYLTFACVVKAVPRLLVPLCVAAAVAAPIYLATVTQHDMGVFHDGALVRCLFGFSLGVLCRKFAERTGERTWPRWADHGWEWAAALACIAYVALCGAGRLTLVAPFVFMLAIWVFSRERGMISQLLRARPFIAAGNLSYSIYMIHWFLLWRYINVLAAVQRSTGIGLVVSADGRTRLVDDLGLQIAAGAVFLAGVIVAAYITMRFVELPGIRAGQKLIARMNARASGAPGHPA